MEPIYHGKNNEETPKERMGVLEGKSSSKERNFDPITK